MMEQKNVKLDANVSKNIQRKTEFLRNDIIAMSAKPTISRFYRAMREYEIICRCSNDTELKKDAGMAIHRTWSGMDLKKEIIEKMLPKMMVKSVHMGLDAVSKPVKEAPSTTGLKNSVLNISKSIVRAIDRFKELDRAITTHTREHVSDIIY